LGTFLAGRRAVGCAGLGGACRAEGGCTGEGSDLEGGAAAVGRAVVDGAAGDAGCWDCAPGGRRAAGLLDRGLAPDAAKDDSARGDVARGDAPRGETVDASNGEAGGRASGSLRASALEARPSWAASGGGGANFCRDKDGNAPAICAGRKASSGIESEFAPGGMISRFWGGLRSVAESPSGVCPGFGGAL
jgi:hypothetical protein